MEIKDGVILNGLRIEVRKILIEAEKTWKQHGRPEGVTITAGLDGKHSAGSLHYYGYAVDLRTRYWTDEEAFRVTNELQNALGNDFDVIFEGNHIHAEYDPE